VNGKVTSARPRRWIRRARRSTSNPAFRSAVVSGRPAALPSSSRMLAGSKLAARMPVSVGQPGGDPGQYCEFVADVVQSVDAGDQIECDVCRWLPGGDRFCDQAYGRNRETGYKVVDQVHAVNLHPVGVLLLLEELRGLEQCSAGPAAQVEPAHGPVIVAQPEAKLVEHVEAKFMAVPVRAGQPAFAVHRAVGHDRGTLQLRVGDQVHVPSHRPPPGRYVAAFGIPPTRHDLDLRFIAWWLVDVDAPCPPSPSWDLHAGGVLCAVPCHLCTVRAAMWLES